MNWYRFFTYIILLISFTTLAWVLWALKPADRTLVNYVSIIGSIASTAGLFLAYIQILTIKEETQKTRARLDASIHQVQRVLMTADLDRSVKIIQDAQNYLNQEKLEIAYVRMKDLRSLLLSFKGNADFQKLTNQSLFHHYFTDLQIDLDNLKIYLLDHSRKINLPRILQHLEAFEVQLIDFENELKR
ncbi:MAG: hypothetical protein MUE30_09870 [Spirosomaceae bacterium]|jgi:hypothetical protein|nr:hypothetical protein [Spirosomataceae bacterium]